MEKPDATTRAWYEAAVPEDPRAVRGQMFGHPCAFTHGNMFFGTFGQSVIVRIGEGRVGEELAGPLVVFEPMAGRPWKEYLQVPRGALLDERLHALVAEALEYTAALPTKEKKEAGKPTKKARKG